jgi:hypothetical protein
MNENILDDWTRLRLPSAPAWPTGVLPQAPRWRRAWAIEVENRAGGRILLHRPAQQSLTLGQVTRAARQFNWNTGFYAAAYLPAGTVVACSRKVLRIRAGGRVATPAQVNEARDAAGVPLVNLLPQDWKRGFESPKEREGIKQANNHIWTDCRDDLFGRWAPPAGSPVYFRNGQRWRPFEERSVSRTTPVPDRLMLVAIRPDRWPAYVEFENWTAKTLQAWRMRQGPAGPVPLDLPVRDGQVLVAWDNDGRNTTAVASVYQRITGVGRFDDTGMASEGRVCTNHPGDLAITTGPGIATEIKDMRDESPERGLLGGLQVIPLRHAWYGMRSKTQFGEEVLGYAAGGEQWMIVGPLLSESLTRSAKELLQAGAADAPQGLEGTAPLFSGYFSPRFFGEENRSASVPRRRRGYVVRLSSDFGRTWSRVPRQPGKNKEIRKSAFSSLTNIRIYFPTTPD